MTKFDQVSEGQVGEIILKVGNDWLVTKWLGDLGGNGIFGDMSSRIEHIRVHTSSGARGL